MAVASAMLCAYFCALLPAIAAESGLGESLGSGACADAELDTNFTCVVRMPVFQINILICNITVIEMNMNNVGFTVYGEHTRACSMENQLQGNCPIDNDELLQPVEVCLVTTLMKQQCKECHNVIAVHIIKPEAPFNLQITYQEEANEYYINFSTPHSGPYLENKLIHELAYRQRNTIWTTRESEYLTLTLLAKEFQPGATYEMKVRSKPNGNYFKGTWSEWSSAKSFKTASRMPVEINNNNNVIMMTATVLCFLVLLIVISLIPIFWKNRIKPAMWPTLPNHKKTLDKLCNKLRKNSDVSFFNPESFEYVDVHKVDSIWAKSKMDCFQHSLLPWDSDVSAKTGNGLEQKNKLVDINHGWLKLPLAYEGMWPAEMLNGRVSRSLQTSGGDTVINANPYEQSSDGGQHSCSDALGNHSSSSTDAMSPLSGLEADHCLQAYTDVRMSNKEEAYVTMASFFKKKGNVGN